MNKTEKAVLDLLGRSLFGKNVSLDENQSFKELYKEAAAHKVFPLVYSALTEKERSLASKEAQAFMESKYFQAISNNIQVTHEQEKILKLLCENGISVLVLKGSGTAAHYPRSELRVLGDIDLLAAADEVPRIVELLQGEGYESRTDNGLHMSVIREDIVIEIHRRPIALDYNENKEIEQRVESYFSDIFKKSILCDNIPVPSVEQAGVITVLHNLEHLLCGELGLRQLCDWAVFVRDCVDLEMWKSLGRVLEDIGVSVFARVMTRAAIDHLGLPETCAPWAEDTDKLLATELVEHILECGNFGEKTDSNYGQRLFVDAHSKSRIKSFFKILMSTCRTHWQACDRHSVLLPIAPFVIFGMYLKNRIKGERGRLRIATLYKRAGTRQRLYRELQPFVTERRG